MKAARFRGEVRSGHKGCAVEVPFDPGERWSIDAASLRPGRRGHRVAARVNGHDFDGWVVGRQRRFYLLVEDEVLDSLGIAAGDPVDVEIGPRS